ncbi:transposable element Tc1 transposase [Trichonephila clavipes]|nr:transposable element Tc1 transposase [Trichonephila clavipes]
MNLVIWNLGQVKRITPELVAPLRTSTPRHANERTLSFNRFNVHQRLNEGLMHVKSDVSQDTHDGVMWKLKCVVPAQVLPSSLDRGSKLRDWRRVIFSDESRFSLSDDDHRTRVWRRTGQRSDLAFIVERHTAISQGTLTARRYVDDILTPIVLPMLSSRAQVPFINRIMLVHILRDSPNNVFKDPPWPARSHSFANRACLKCGKTAAVQDINCADAKTMAGSLS